MCQILKEGLRFIGLGDTTHVAGHHGACTQGTQHRRTFGRHFGNFKDAIEELLRGDALRSRFAPDSADFFAHNIGHFLQRLCDDFLPDTKAHGFSRIDERFAH